MTAAAARIVLALSNTAALAGILVGEREPEELFDKCPVRASRQRLVECGCGVRGVLRSPVQANLTFRTSTFASQEHNLRPLSRGSGQSPLLQRAGRSSHAGINVNIDGTGREGGSAEQSLQL